MQNFADASWDEIMQAVTTLPNSWQPRREQPEWDRDFSGNQEIQTSFSRQTDKAREWMVFALAFSDTVRGGFRASPDDDDFELIYFGGVMRGHIAKGTAQGLDAR